MAELKSNISAKRIDCRKVSAKPRHKNSEADLRKYLTTKKPLLIGTLPLKNFKSIYQNVFEDRKF